MLPLGVPRVRSTMEWMESKEGSGQGEGIPEEKGAKLDDENTKDEDDETSILLKRQAELLRRINGSQNVTSPSMTNPTFSTGILPTDTITPQRKAHTVYPPLAAKDGFEGHTWNEWRRGVRNEKGDMAFYDASFVEDPWRGLRGKTTGDGVEGAG